MQLPHMLFYGPPGTGKVATNLIQANWAGNLLTLSFSCADFYYPRLVQAAVRPRAVQVACARAQRLRRARNQRRPRQDQKLCQDHSHYKPRPVSKSLRSIGGLLALEREWQPSQALTASPSQPLQNLPRPAVQDHHPRRGRQHDSGCAVCAEAYHGESLEDY